MRGMKRALISGAATIGTLLGATGAMAAAGDLPTTVEVITPNVTYSTDPVGKFAGQTTQVIYRVSLQNISTNTINNVVFQGTASVTDLQEAAAFLSSDPANLCSLITSPAGAPSNAVTISCDLGQFKSGDAKSFYLFFAGPKQDTVSPTGAGLDYVSFKGQVLYAEGVNGGNSFNNSIVYWDLTNSVLLGTTSSVSLKSGSSKSGGTFFTGTGGVPLSGDQFATTIGIPTSPLITTTDVEETPIGSSAAGTCTNFSNCYRSTIAVVDTATNTTAVFTATNYLTIILRIDSSNILPGTKIGSVVIWYTPTGSTTSVIVGDCASPTSPRSDGLPCIAKRIYYKNKSVPGWTPDLDGDFEWDIIGLKNGSFFSE